MPQTRESLPAVTAAGVSALIFSVLGAFGCLLVGLTLLVMPQLPTAQAAPQLAPGIRGMTAVVMFFLFALAVSGVFVGIGVIRRRNWARITILVWGGLMAFFCLSAVVFSFLAFSSISGLDVRNSDGADVSRVMQLTRIFVVFFYGIPAGVGIWWLILFTRPKVAAAFTTPMAVAPSLDASGFPQPPDQTLALKQNRPSCPLPLAIVAAFLLVGAICIVLMFAFFPIPKDTPLFLFGRSSSGASARFFMALFGVISGAASIGIFLLKPWALYTEIALQFLGLLNCVATLFSPNFAPAMRAMMEKIYSQNPAFASGSPFMSDAYFRSIMIFSSLVVSAILAVLLWQRPRFLEAAAAAKT
jgi:hypothetical protein